jgi:hypothetical protein
MFLLSEAGDDFSKVLWAIVDIDSDWQQVFAGVPISIPWCSFAIDEERPWVWEVGAGVRSGERRRNEEEDGERGLEVEALGHNVKMRNWRAGKTRESEVGRENEEGEWAVGRWNGDQDRRKEEESSVEAANLRIKQQTKTPTQPDRPRKALRDKISISSSRVHHIFVPLSHK